MKCLDQKDKQYLTLCKEHLNCVLVYSLCNTLTAKPLCAPSKSNYLRNYLWKLNYRNRNVFTQIYKKIALQSLKNEHLYVENVYHLLSLTFVPRLQEMYFCQQTMLNKTCMLYTFPFCPVLIYLTLYGTPVVQKLICHIEYEQLTSWPHGPVLVSQANDTSLPLS